MASEGRVGQMGMKCTFNIGKIFLHGPRLLKWAMWPMGLLYFILLIFHFIWHLDRISERMEIWKTPVEKFHCLLQIKGQWNITCLCTINRWYNTKGYDTMVRSQFLCFDHFRFLRYIIFYCFEAFLKMCLI
jgi:hypothetical protein